MQTVVVKIGGSLAIDEDKLEQFVSAVASIPASEYRVVVVLAGGVGDVCGPQASGQGEHGCGPARTIGGMGETIGGSAGHAQLYDGEGGATG